MSPNPDDPVVSVADIQAHFTAFQRSFPRLRLYSAICAGAALDDEVAGLLLSARPGQARPVLLLAALHDLVLQDPSVPAARWYASVVGRDGVPDGDPWPDVRVTVLDHQLRLREVVSSRVTQTNEVNRCVYLAELLRAAVADLPDLPVSLVEIGASAGLLLAIDRYRTDLVDTLGTVVLGESASPVRCSGRLEGDAADRTAPLPVIEGRAGLDLHPVRSDDRDELRWLQACIWPDVPGRVERFVAAVQAIRADPPPLVAGDAVGDVAAAIAAADELASPTAHLVVLTSWALTYVERSRREGLTRALAGFAESERPVTWVSAEPPGTAPGVSPPDWAQEGGTVLGVRRWRGGRDLGGVALGCAHPHGAWVRRS